MVPIKRDIVTLVEKELLGNGASNIVYPKTIAEAVLVGLKPLNEYIDDSLVKKDDVVNNYINQDPDKVVSVAALTRLYFELFGGTLPAIIAPKKTDSDTYSLFSNNTIRKFDFTGSGTNTYTLDLTKLNNYDTSGNDYAVQYNYYGGADGAILAVWKNEDEVIGFSVAVNPLSAGGESIYHIPVSSYSVNSNNETDYILNYSDIASSHGQPPYPAAMDITHEDARGFSINKIWGDVFPTATTVEGRVYNSGESTYAEDNNGYVGIYRPEQIITGAIPALYTAITSTEDIINDRIDAIVDLNSLVEHKA